jgi:hypothetical protein
LHVIHMMWKDVERAKPKGEAGFGKMLAPSIFLIILTLEGRWRSRRPLV